MRTVRNLVRWCQTDITFLNIRFNCYSMSMEWKNDIIYSILINFFPQERRWEKSEKMSFLIMKHTFFSVLLNLMKKINFAYELYHKNGFMLRTIDVTCEFRWNSFIGTFFKFQTDCFLGKLRVELLQSSF